MSHQQIINGFKGWFALPILMPLRCLDASCLRRAQDKTFVQRRNRYGESGSPCLKTLAGLKGLEGLPLIRIL
jgi:hypothetical protein